MKQMTPASPSSGFSGVDSQTFQVAQRQKYT
jgi:hypothetical protein